MPALPPPSSPALRIAIVGAESTGKTTLARTLAQALTQAVPQPLARPHAPAPAPSAPPSLIAPGHTAPAARVAWVPEWLRHWCDAHGRTPRADEQAAIAAEQHARIDAAAATHDIVVCDTTALMTAVYSRLLFGDRSLEARAVALHRSIDLTLLTALDLPWVADGHQRDGPHVREPVDDALRKLMRTHGLAYAVVAGHGAQRLGQALAAVKAHRAPGVTPPLFTRLLGAAGTADMSATALRRWLCDCCVPEAEPGLRRRA